MTHTAEFGSQIARNGFRNESDVIDKFNNWREDTESQNWLSEMGYALNSIESVEAITGNEAKNRLIDEGMVFERGNVKTDVSVIVLIKMKNSNETQNISVKLVTVNSYPKKDKYTGFNQIDKRWVNKYQELWNIPESITKTLKHFTGELQPYISNTRDNRRMYLDEMKTKDTDELLEFFESKKVLIVSDVLKGRGALSAEWLLVALNKTSDDQIVDTIWTFKSINEVINHYSHGNVEVSNRGGLNIGKITVQRKGGDGGRPTANMLQFKFDPLDILYKS